MSVALTGYALEIHRRDNWVCVYCGLDGKVWPNWLFLTQDHLLPVGHPDREMPAYRVTACSFCNVLYNRTVFEVDGKTPEEIVALKKPLILDRRETYRQFWEEHVKPGNAVEPV